MLNGIKASDIAFFLNSKVIGEDIEIFCISSISNLQNNCLSFINKRVYEEDIDKTALILVNKDYSIVENSKNSYIKVDNPRLAFAKVVEEFFYKKRESCISINSQISKKAKLGRNVFIGENVVIEDGVFIGDNTIIEHNVVILRNCKIGESCRIAPGVVIGDDGLGSVKDEDGNLMMIRHLGRVVIEDFVEIGANSTIARGTIDNTLIKEFTKIGPQVNIGHNTIIGKNCEIAGRTHTSGSVKIGDDCFLGANCSIRDGVTIGSGCTIGIGSVVVRDIEDNKTIMGLEALDLRKLAKVKREIGWK